MRAALMHSARMLLLGVTGWTVGLLVAVVAQALGYTAYQALWVSNPHLRGAGLLVPPGTGPPAAEVAR